MKLMQTASVLAVCHLVTCKIKNIALILVKIPPDSCIKWLGTGVSSLNVELCLNIRDLEKSRTAPY